MITTLEEQIADYQKKMKKKLDPIRYVHVISVSYTAMMLAARYGCDVKKAQIAGVLHDCAKRYTDEELIAKCQKRGIALSEEEIKAPAVIHAKYGAWLAEHKYGVQDPEILSAIACHTTGKPEMTDLDKIIYIADYIEPFRDKASNLTKVRELAFKDLDKTLLTILKSTLEYLKSKGAVVDPMTLQAYLYYNDAKKKAARKKKEAVKNAKAGKAADKASDKTAEKANKGKKGAKN